MPTRLAPDEAAEVDDVDFAPKHLWSSAVAALGLSAALLAWPILGRGSFRWTRDWHYFQHHAHAARENFLAGSWPDFDPWHCAGFDMAANPQGWEGHPLFALVVAFGPTLGLRLAVWVSCAMGGAGLAWVLRRHRVPACVAVWGGVAWSLGPALASHLAEGHVPFTQFLLVPLWLERVYVAMHMGARGQRAAVAAGAIGASMLLMGGFYALGFGAVLAAVGAGVAWWSKATSPRRVLAGASIAFGVLAALSAPKLLPVLDALLEFPRQALRSDGLDLASAWRAWTDRAVGPATMAGQPYNFWPEYALYPGWGVLFLAAIGGALTRRTHGVLWRLAAAWVVVSLVLSLGDAVPPVDAVRRAVPFVGNLQGPARFALLAFAGLVVWGGLGIVWLHRRSRWTAAIVAVAALVDLGWQTSQWWELPKTSEPFGDVALPPTAVQALAAPAVAIDSAPAAGVSLLPCYEPMPHRTAPALAARPGLVPLLDSPVESEVEFRAPGRLRLSLGGAAARIHFVCNPYWHAVGAEISCEAGVLVLTPAESPVESATPVELRYSNPHRRMGQAVQGVGLVGLGWWWWWAGRRRKRFATPKP